MADSLLDNYNPLYDIHLRQYFALPHMQKHLKKMGLLESTLNLNGDEVYERHHAMMDMMLKNREAQLMKMAELRKKLDAAEKVELCRRIRSGQSPESYRRGKPSRSLSRSRTAQKGGRQRRFSNSFEDKDFVQNIEMNNTDPEDKKTNDPYKRLSANAKRFNYLHKLDDSTLIAYKDNLKKQLQRLERFREISFGPHSVARQPPQPQTSWFFRRRSMMSVRGRKAAPYTGNRTIGLQDSRTSCPPTNRKRQETNSRLPPITGTKIKPIKTTTRLPPSGKKSSQSPARGRSMTKRITTTSSSTSNEKLPIVVNEKIADTHVLKPTIETLESSSKPIKTPTPPSTPVMRKSETFDIPSDDAHHQLPSTPDSPELTLENRKQTPVAEPMNYAHDDESSISEHEKLPDIHFPDNKIANENSYQTQADYASESDSEPEYAEEDQDVEEPAVQHHLGEQRDDAQKDFEDHETLHSGIASEDQVDIEHNIHQKDHTADTIGYDDHLVSHDIQHEQQSPPHEFKDIKRSVRDLSDQHDVEQSQESEYIKPAEQKQEYSEIHSTEHSFYQPDSNNVSMTDNISSPDNKESFNQSFVQNMHSSEVHTVSEVNSTDYKNEDYQDREDIHSRESNIEPDFMMENKTIRHDFSEPSPAMEDENSVHSSDYDEKHEEQPYSSSQMEQSVYIESTMDHNEENLDDSHNREEIPGSYTNLNERENDNKTIDSYEDEVRDTQEPNYKESSEDVNLLYKSEEATVPYPPDHARYGLTYDGIDPIGEKMHSDELTTEPSQISLQNIVTSEVESPRHSEEMITTQGYSTDFPNPARNSEVEEMQSSPRKSLDDYELNYNQADVMTTSIYAPSEHSEVNDMMTTTEHADSRSSPRQVSLTQEKPLDGTTEPSFDVVEESEWTNGNSHIIEKTMERSMTSQDGGEKHEVCTEKIIDQFVVNDNGKREDSDDGMSVPEQVDSSAKFDMDGSSESLVIHDANPTSYVERENALASPIEEVERHWDNGTTHVKEITKTSEYTDENGGTHFVQAESLTTTTILGDDFENNNGRESISDHHNGFDTTENGNEPTRQEHSTAIPSMCSMTTTGIMVSEDDDEENISSL